MKFFKKELHTGLLFAVILTILYGCVIIFSASQAIESVAKARQMNFAFKQLIFFSVTLTIVFIIYFINLKHIANFSWVLYFITLALLILVMKFGKSSHGAQRWIDVGPLVIQPSEFAKIAIILTLARYMSWNLDKSQKFYFIIIACLIVVIPLVLIVKQPDLGTAITIMPILISMLFMSGIKKRYFLSMLPFAAIPIVIVILAKNGFITTEEIRKALFFLKTYQQNRLLVFIDPNIDPKGMSYNLIQSQIAIGSGGFFGKGFLAGTQTHLKFIPERHTDFIFSVLGEEWGFIGGIVLLILYFFILHFGLNIAQTCEDYFCKLAAAGIVTLISFHIITNIGMTIGIMPITGVPLPFISYGGSSLLTMMILIGLLLNFNANKKQILFR